MDVLAALQRRSLKPALRLRHTLRHVAQLVAAEIRAATPYLSTA